MNRTRLRRKPGADELASVMTDADDTMRTIISETVASAQNGAIKESGRTVCPQSVSVKGPLGRFRRSIDLAACPSDSGGTFHTHVSPGELRTPTNSLPDMANVVYGLIDVSVVAGTRSADVIVAADDDETMVEAFENAVGERFGNPRSLFQAIKEGRINPPAARERVRTQMSELISTVNTGYTDLEPEIEGVPAANWAAPSVSGSDESFAGRAAPVYYNPESVDAAASKLSEVTDGSKLTSLVVSTTVGTVVGGVIDRLIFGD